MAQSIIVAEGNTPSDAYQNNAHIPINQANNGQTKNGEVNLTSISLFQTSLLAALISAIIWLAITYIIAI